MVRFIVPLRAIRVRAISVVMIISTLSNGHAQTAAAPKAPTGVAASDAAYVDKTAVTWDPVPNATAYRILRSATNDPATATVIGATNSWVYWDTSAPAGQVSYYWVRAETAAGPSELGAGDAGSRGRALGGGAAGPTLQPPPEPAGNPVTLAKVALGKTLFWDEQLSASKRIACGTCHVPEKGFVDSRSILGAARSRNVGPDGLLGTNDDVTGSPGVPLMDSTGNYVWDAIKGYGEQVTGRIGRPASDAGYSAELFWDGRASGVFRDPVTNAIVLSSGGALESQSLGPIVNSVEMAESGRTWNAVTTTLAAAWPLALASDVPSGLAQWIGSRTYPELFQDVFGSPEITPVRIAFALASYERTLFSDRTPFDQANAQLVARPAAAQRGLAAFNGKTCATCHAGATFSDGLFHHLGVRPIAAAEDAGRFVVTKANADRGMFLTAGLRNVGLRGPYMHTGTIATLPDVMNFYDRGGDFNSAANEIRGINLNPQERADLIAFLLTLTDPRLPARQYPFDRPTLFSESNRVPVLAGAAVAGTGNVAPHAISVSPALLGNPQFTFAVQGGLGGATAVLVVDTKEPPADRIPAAAEVLSRITLTLAGSGAGNGHAAVPWVVPGEQASAGTRYYARWYIVDPAAPAGVAASERMDFTSFGEHGTSSVAAGAARLANLSARVLVGGDAGTPIAGFVVNGATGKRVVVRAAGPALVDFGVADFLRAPALEFVRDGVVTATNAGWLAADAPVFASVGAFALPAGSRDAGLVISLPSGNTTALVRAADGGTGVALLEAYDTDGASATGRLAGLSMRAKVGTGSSQLIGGLNVQGGGNLTLLVRAVGPGLTSLGVGGALADPQLTLYRGSTVIATNDNWDAGTNAAQLQAAAVSVGDFTLAPGSRDAALLATVAEGSYTIVVAGAGGSTGTALLEIYVLP